MGRPLHLHLGNVPPFPSAQRENRNETMKIYEKIEAEYWQVFNIYFSNLQPPGDSVK